MLRRLLWPLVALVVVVEATPKYIARLPNGAGVASSKALGHVLANGTGALNAFGRHFIFSARNWSVWLCQTDSDGDGQTNGQELGDPCCEWVAGDTPRFTDGVSHPGDRRETSNESRWINLACPNDTKLTRAESSGVSARCLPWSSSTRIVVVAAAVVWLVLLA